MAEQMLCGCTCRMDTLRTVLKETALWLQTVGRLGKRGFSHLPQYLFTEFY